MELTFYTNHTVIVAFIFTVIALCVATMFLSCFGKKKDKKKNKKRKSPSPPPAPKPQDASAVKKELAVDQKASPDVRVSGEADDLGDFSAVQRETEILRSEINDESTLQLSFTSHQDETDREEPKSTAPEVEPESPSVKHNTSQGRSSMLDDIEQTLATLSTETKKEVTDVHTGVLKAIDDTEKKVTTVKEDVTTEKEVVEKQMKKNEAAFDLNVAPAIIHTEKTVKEETKETVTTESVSFKLEKAKDDVKDKTVSYVTEVKEEVEKKTISTVNAGVSKLEDVKVEIENKASTLISSPDTETSDKKDAKPEEPEEKKKTIHEDLSDKFGQFGEQIKTNITSVIAGVQETVTNKFGGATADTKESENDEKKEDDEKEKASKEEIKINGTINDLEKTSSSLVQDMASSPKTEIKIPPKVSPKPSPKGLRPLLTKSDAIQISSSQESTTSKDEPTPEPKEEPASPTSPTSPVSPTQAKSQSRIPMSKKTSAIPKLSFGSSNKSSSVSPLSSPDSSTAKKVEAIPTAIQKEGKEIIDKVKEVADSTTHDLTHNNQESHRRDSKEKSPEPEKNNSPFERENRGSKSRLTKLRYSGKKSTDNKSADSKSDESGSERGSRAGSEAKSEDGKKQTEVESEQDKTSRIPVRAGSKPRSSPPKALE